MLAVNKYTQEYVYECKSKVELQLSTYRNLTAKAKHLDKTNDRSLHHTIEAFEKPFLNNMVLVLEAMFAHRTRALEGRDNTLNDVRLLCKEILNNGNAIALNVTQFEKIAKDFFDEIEKKYV
jgi:hypothetical protein